MYPISHEVALEHGTKPVSAETMTFTTLYITISTTPVDFGAAQLNRNKISPLPLPDRKSVV